MKHHRLVTAARDRRRARVGRRPVPRPRSARPAADLRQPAADGRQRHLRRAPGAAARRSRWCGNTRAADLTSFPATGTTDPGANRKLPLADAYRRTARRGICRLAAVGRGPGRPPAGLLAGRPQSASTRGRRSPGTRARRAGPRSAQWTGVPLSLVLDAVGLLPTARFVVFHSYDDWIDSIDLLDALHPQTILAYGDERTRSPDRPRRAGAAAGRAADRLQEHEVPAAHRRDRRVRRWRREGEHPERVGLVHGDLMPRARPAAQALLLGIPFEPEACPALRPAVAASTRPGR